MAEYVCVSVCVLNEISGEDDDEGRRIYFNIKDCLLLKSSINYNTHTPTLGIIS